jgi:hypothetical protein
MRVLPQPGLVQILIHPSKPAAESKLLVAVGATDAAPQKIPLRSAGWQRVTLPIPPEKWKDGDPGPIRLSVSGDCGEIRIAAQSHPAWPSGPGLSDAQLLALLDLERPELAGVRDAVRQGDKTEAMRRLVRHFRDRRTPVWLRPPAEMSAQENRDLVAHAEKNLNGEFAMLGHRYTYPNGNVDWHLDPTAGTKAQTHEWVWSISRHEFASRWKHAFETNGDTRYPEAWGRTVSGWTDAMPVPSTDWGWAGSGWRILEAGIRTGEFWPDAWEAFRLNPAFSDDALVRMLKSFYEHADFLAAKPPFAGNFFVLANCGLYTTAVLFPEFKDSPAWRKTAVANLEKCIVPNTGTDGGWYELSPSYHQWIVDKLALVLSCAERNGCRGNFAAEFRTLLRKMSEWNVRISTPDRKVPSLNDSSRLTIPSVTTPLLLEAYAGSTVLPWAAALASGKTPGATPPLPASEFLEPSGYMVMRTSWEGNASYLLFDVGPMGGGHGHLDALNVLYWPDGVAGLFDGTGGTYDKTPFRPWSMATMSHNTMTIDGRNQFRPKPTKDDPAGKLPPETPAPVFTETPDFIYAKAWHVGGYGKEQQVRARHRREIVFMKESGVALILDTMTPEDDQPHAYDLRWHAATTTSHTGPDGAVVCGNEASPLLAILPLTPADGVHADSGATKPEILGWDVIKGGVWDKSKSGPPVPALTVRHLRKASGPVTFATLLVPPSQFPEPGKPWSISRTTPTAAKVVQGGKEWAVDWGLPGDAAIALKGFSPAGVIEVGRD